MIQYTECHTVQKNLTFTRGKATIRHVRITPTPPPCHPRSDLYNPSRGQHQPPTILQRARLLEDNARREVGPQTRNGGAHTGARSSRRPQLRLLSGDKALR